MKDILLCAGSVEVASIVAADLERLARGDHRDETSWIDVQVHACRLLNSMHDVVFVTASELTQQARYVEYARQEGRRIVTVPDTLILRLAEEYDIVGRPVQVLNQFTQAFNGRFEYHFVAESEMTEAERSVFALRVRLLSAAGVSGEMVREVLVSTTVLPARDGTDDALGVWDSTRQRIVIRRDMLSTAEAFASVLLHEAAHVISGATDMEIAFENALTLLLGRVSTSLLKQIAAGAAPVGSASTFGAHRSDVEDWRDARPLVAPTRVVDVAASPVPSSTLSGPTSAADLNRLFPWAQFDAFAGGSVAPRLASILFAGESLALHVRPAGVWADLLRDAGVASSDGSSQVAYAGERALRSILRRSVAAHSRSSPDYAPDGCNNRTGTVVRPACVGRRARYVATVTPRSGAPELASSHHLCRTCAKQLRSEAAARGWRFYVVALGKSRASE